MSILSPQIEHVREIIRDDGGRIEQIYNYLIYSFDEPPLVTARTYLDDCARVIVMRPGPIDDWIMDYLKERFWQIDQWGKDSYMTIWPHD